MIATWFLHCLQSTSIQLFIIACNLLRLHAVKPDTIFVILIWFWHTNRLDVCFHLRYLSIQLETDQNITGFKMIVLFYSYSMFMNEIRTILYLYPSTHPFSFITFQSWAMFHWHCLPKTQLRLWAKSTGQPSFVYKFCPKSLFIPLHSSTLIFYPISHHLIPTPTFKYKYSLHN